MKVFKTVLAALLLLIATQAASGQELRTRGKLLKENAELRSRIDSLIRELEVFRLEKSVADSLAAEMIALMEENAELEEELVEEYSPEMTDSLLSLWYVHRQMEVTKELTEYDMDSVRFTSDVPDAVLIERLEKMNSYITLPFNETVKNYMVLYSEKMPTKMGSILGLSSYYMPIFEDIFNRYGLPQELKAMAIIESALNPVAVSRAGAKGMWQFMYNTAKTYGLRIDSYVDERLDVEKAADAAARYLLDAYNIFGDWCLAISSYNCGAGNVNKAIKRAGSKDFWAIYPYLPKETRGYMPAFVGALYAMTYYKEYGIVPEPVQMPAHTDTFEIRRNLHFSQISEVIGIPKEELQNLNPQYIHDVIPGNEGTFVLKLPYNYTNAFLDNQDSLYTHKSVEMASSRVLEGPAGVTDSQERIAYKVKSGDYLGRIASRYGVTVKQLQQWNNLRGTNLRIGQTLYIYRNGSKPASSSSTSSSSSSSSSSSTSDYITYTVKSGDSLYKIAQRYPGVSVNDIMRINSISSNIKPGMKLKIPKK